MNSWDEMIAKNWTDCDLEVQESGQIFRGRIMKVAKTIDSIQVVMRWSATLRPDGTWHYDPPAYGMSFGYFSFPMLYTLPGDIGQGRVAIRTPIGIAVFYPRDVSRLDPAKVHGLPPEFAEPDFVDPKD